MEIALIIYHNYILTTETHILYHFLLQNSHYESKSGLKRGFV